MKRFAWIYGAVGGVLGTPLLLSLCYAKCLALFVPGSAFADCGTPFAAGAFEESLYIQMEVLSGALLGALSIAWLYGPRGLVLRGVGVLVGMSISGFYLCHMVERYSQASRYGGDGITFARLASYAPLVLWGLLVCFFSGVGHSRWAT